MSDVTPVRPTTPPPTGSGSNAQSNTANTGQTGQNPAQQAAATGQGSSAGTTQSVSLPAHLANLSAGQKLLAQVTGATPSGESVLQTSSGTLIGSITPTPSKGTELLLRLLNVDTAIQARVISSNGVSTQGGQAAVNLTLTKITADPQASQPQPAQATQSAAPTLNSMVGQSLTATLTPNSGTAVQQPLLLKILGFQVPQTSTSQGATSQGQPSTQAQPSSQTQPSTQTVPQSTPNTTSPNTTQSGSAAQSPVAQGAAAYTATGAATGATTSTSGQSLLATVLGTQKGMMTLQTSSGQISLPAPQTPVPPGTTLEIQTQQPASPYSAAARMAALSDVARMGALQQLSSTWPALDEVMKVLQGLDPALAQSVQNRLPGVGPQMGQNLLMFVMTLGRGSVQSMIGQEATRALEQAGRQTLLNQLGDDFTQLARLASDGGGHPDWRTILFPLYDGSQYQQVQMYIERHKKRKGQQAPPEGVRFLIGLDFSELGNLQLDGRIHEDLSLVEMALRSHMELEDQIKADIGEIFRSQLEAAGWVGTLSFVVNDSFPIDPMEEMLGTKSGDYVHSAHSATPHVTLDISEMPSSEAQKTSHQESE